MKRQPGPLFQPDSGPSLPRRQFLKAAAGAASAALLISSPVQASPHQRRFGRHDEVLPVIGMGTWRTFDVDPGDARVPQLSQVLRRFAEAGGKLVDSSPMYGRSEAMLGSLARRQSLTDRLFFATKVWTEGEAQGRRQMDTSAKYFHRQVIDLLQVHNMLDLRTQLATIRQRQAQGRVRYAGVSHYLAGAHHELAELIRKEPIDAIQINYSILAREAEETLLPLAADRGVAVIINRPFQEGQLFRQVAGRPVPDWAGEYECESWAELFLKFIIGHPAVSAVIPATSDPAHMEQNMRAGQTALIEGQARERMARRIIDTIRE